MQSARCEAVDPLGDFSCTRYDATADTTTPKSFTPRFIANDRFACRSGTQQRAVRQVAQYKSTVRVRVWKHPASRCYAGVANSCR